MAATPRPWCDARAGSSIAAAHAVLGPAPNDASDESGTCSCAQHGVFIRWPLTSRPSSSRASPALGALLARRHVRRPAHGRGGRGCRCRHRRVSDDRRNFDHRRRLGVVIQLGVAGADAPGPSEPLSPPGLRDGTCAELSQLANAARCLRVLCVCGVNFVICSPSGAKHKAPARARSAHTAHGRPSVAKSPPPGQPTPPKDLDEYGRASEGQ